MKLKKNICGAVLADKPSGMPSTTLVTHLRHKLEIKRIGHTGILDRVASGLMLLLVGRATGLAQFFLHADKGYHAEFHFGKSTDTHDRQGQVLDELSEERVQEFLQKETKSIETVITSWTNLKEQKPPIYSALKQGGRRLSDHARMGQVVEVASRPVQIYESSILAYEPKKSRVRVYLHVSGGTYVRALARDLSEQIGIPLHLGALRRTKIGSHQMVEDDNANTIWRPEKTEPNLLSVQETFPLWPRLVVQSPEDRKRILQGVILPIQKLKGEAPKMVQENFFIEDEQANCLAWAVRTTGSYRYQRVLAG